MCTLGEFAQVDLGPTHGPRVKAMVKEGKPGLQSDYPCVIFRFAQAEHRLMMNPIRERWGDFLGYRFVLTTLMLVFFVSGHITESRFWEFAPSEKGTLVAPLVTPEQMISFKRVGEYLRRCELPRSMQR